MLELLQFPEFRNSLMSTDSSLFIHGKQFKHWINYKSSNIGLTGADAVNLVVDEMLNNLQSSTFKDANEEDVEMAG